MATLEHAKKLHDLGWQVVAAPIGGKTPVGKWKDKQSKRLTKAELAKEFDQPRNVFVITGAISRLVVLDCDDQKAVKWWREKLGPILDETTRASTGRGTHYYFALPEGANPKGRSSPGGESGAWDLRAAGGGVVAPPSVHSSGKVYRWARGHGPEALQLAPATLISAEPKKAEEGPRTSLSWLLAHRPEPGARNNWLAAVAGHYAAQLRYQDAYEESVRTAAAGLGLADEEVTKTIESIWTAEQAKEGKALPPPPEEGGGDWRITDPTEDTGYLASGDHRLLCLCKMRDPENEGKWIKVLKPWASADMRAIGLFHEEDQRTYTIEVRTDDGVKEVMLPSRVLGNATRLKEQLIGWGVKLYNPPEIEGRASYSDRLALYLDAQKPPESKAVPALGWDKLAQGFLTHTGVLRADGWHDFNGVRPNPYVKQWANYEYGLGEESTATEILLEILTFHDDKVAALFGSWWAACFLKPQLRRFFSQFPVMALEAPSESGKSTGFFPSLIELSGNVKGKDLPTKASLRDYLSAHRNGIVWVDDMDDLSSHEELIRQTTVDGSVTKKAPDQRTQISTLLTAALVISGEGLGLRDQKALEDRCIHIDVPSPVGRRSKKGDYAQWDDIVELRKAHDFQDYAGTLVCKALQIAPSIEARAKNLRTHPERHSGRLADTIDVMVIGAEILEHLYGKQDGWAREWVNVWARGVQDANIEADNKLTKVLIPSALAKLGIKSQPEGPDPTRTYINATPVFVRGNGSVWFSPKLLAMWWRDYTHGKMEERTDTESAIEQQARALGAGGKKGVDRKHFKYLRDINEGGSNYWRLPLDMSKLVVERAEGGDCGR